MNDQQRTILIWSLCLLAVCLPPYFMRYHEGRQSLPTAEEFFSDTTDWPESGLIFRTGLPTSDAGIYSRQEFSANSAALLGIVSPFILFTAAAFLWTGRANTKNQTKEDGETLVEQVSQPFFGNGFKTLWEGGHPLARAFFGYYVLGAIGCFIVSVLAIVPFAILHVAPLGYLLAYGLMGVYGAIATVGVWRSASAAPPPLWPSALVKAVVTCWTVGVFVYLANGGFRRIVDLIAQN